MVVKFLCVIVMASTLVCSHGFLYGSSLDKTKKEVKDLARGLTREDFLIMILDQMEQDTYTQQVASYSVRTQKTNNENISLLQGLSGGAKIDFANYGKQIDEKLKNLETRDPIQGKQAREIIYKTKTGKLKGN